MKVFKIAGSPYTSLAMNAAYAIGNSLLGFLNHSWWFITVGAYDTVLAITRFSVLQVKRNAGGDHEIEQFARRITGILLVVLSFCIVGVNIFTGTAVWVVILLLGINLTGGKYPDMAKSKIIQANEKIAEAVTSGYKKIERGVVGGYTKLEDKFVEAYLTKDNETVEEAKERLKNRN